MNAQAAAGERTQQRLSAGTSAAQQEGPQPHAAAAPAAPPLSSSKYQGSHPPTCSHLVNMKGTRWPRCSASEEGPCSRVQGGGRSSAGQGS